MKILLTVAPRAPRTALMVACAALSLAATACGSPSSVNAAAAGGVDKTHVTIAWNSTPDESYLPLLAAIDTMKGKGFDIEAKTLSGSDVSFQSLAANQIQFTADSLPPGALSVDKGATVKIIGTRNANLVVWVARKAYQDCSKLDGKPVGIYSETGGYTVLMKLYFQANCPGVKPTYVTIPDSPLRAQAVATDRLAGTALSLPDAVVLQKQYGDQLFVAPLRKALPGVGDEYVYTNAQVLKDHPTIAQALLEAQLQTIRDVYADPSKVDALVKKYLPAAKDSSVAHQFITEHIWYASGGLGGPGLPNTLKAFDLPGSPDKLQDKGPLTSVLDRLGKSTATDY